MDFLAWARSEFGDVHLGDLRRERRAVAVASALAQSAGRSLPAALPAWHDLIAAYRLFSSPHVTREALLAPHFSRTRAAISTPAPADDPPPEFLLIEDTTELDFSSHRATEGLGRVGNDHGQGAYLHSTLVLQTRPGPAAPPPTEPLGLLHAETWLRTDTSRKARETRAERNRRADRESQRWGRCFIDDPTLHPPPGVRWIYVADRESDIYELLAERIPGEVDFVVRASRPRRTKAGPSVFTTVRAAVSQGPFTVTIAGRGGRPARSAVLELRSAGATVLAPGRLPVARQRPLELNIVEAWENDPPAGVEPLCWVLLTSLSAATREDCERVLGVYRQRWQIEDFHKCLKSGTRYESARLGSWGALSVFLGFALVLAVELLRLRWASRQDEWPAGIERPAARLVEYLREKTGEKMSGEITPGEYLRALARLGGFLGRKGDGQPGWETIWRGMQRMLGFLDALDFLESQQKPPTCV